MYKKCIFFLIFSCIRNFQRSDFSSVKKSTAALSTKKLEELKFKRQEVEEQKTENENTFASLSIQIEIKILFILNTSSNLLVLGLG